MHPLVVWMRKHAIFERLQNGSHWNAFTRGKTLLPICVFYKPQVFYTVYRTAISWANLKKHRPEANAIQNVMVCILRTMGRTSFVEHAFSTSLFHYSFSWIIWDVVWESEVRGQSCGNLRTTALCSRHNFCLHKGLNGSYQNNYNRIIRQQGRNCTYILFPSHIPM